MRQDWAKDSPGLRRFFWKGFMLLELAIVPLARGASLSADVPDLIRLIDSMAGSQLM